MPRAKRVFYGWYIVAASVVLNFYLSVVFYQGFQAFFLPISQEFKWSRALTSGAFSLRQLESGLLAPVVGFLVDRWGPRAIILLGVILGGGGLVMMGYITSLWTFYVALLIVSLGVSGASHGVSWAVAVANWFRRLRGRALGIAMLGPVVGGPFVVIAALMEEALGWRMAVLLSGVGLWLIGIPIALVARSRPETYGYLPDGDILEDSEGMDGNGAVVHASEGLTVGQALRTRDFWVLMVLFGTQFVGTSGLMVHLIPLLQDTGYTAAGAATVLGLIFLLSGIGRIGAGATADLLDYRIVMVGLTVSQIVALFLLTDVGPSQYWQVGGFMLLFGVGFGGTIPLRPFIIMQLFGARATGALQGLVQGGGVVAGMMGPVFYGWVFDITGSYDMAIYASMAVTLVAVPFAFLLSAPQGVSKSSG